MRCMIGLDRMQSGTALFDGKSYRELKKPLHEVGALLDAGNAHSGRTARNHLRWLAMSNGMSPKRVDEVLELVGLTDVAKKRVGQFSLGMKQRLGIASVMLGDPKVVILDEPANGLDPEGIRWIREMLKHLASQGRSVLVSSHLLSEMALMADDLAHLPFAVGLSRHTRGIIRQNVFVSLGVVAFLVPATILGLGIGPAVAVHEGSTLLVVINALRLLAYRDPAGKAA